jgi:hypothetical protein
VITFDKKYDGESIVDLGRDVHEAFYPEFNPIMNEIPKDEYNFHKGTFKVTIEWIEE